MKKSLVILLLSLSTQAQAFNAFANSYMGTVEKVGDLPAIPRGTTMVVMSPTMVLLFSTYVGCFGDGFCPDKQVIAAKEDAAFFLATGGEYRSATLESALASVREQTASVVQASDLEIVEFILNY